MTSVAVRQAVEECRDDGCLTEQDFALFLTHYKAHNGSEKTDAFLAHFTRKLSPLLSAEEKSQADRLFQMIDADHNGTLEREEIIAYYHRHWSEAHFPDNLVAEEEGHVHLPAWLQFLTDLKTTKGASALHADLKGRELNQEHKARLDPYPHMPPTSTFGLHNAGMALKSPRGGGSPNRSLSPAFSPRMLTTVADQGDDELDENTSVLQAMEQNPQLVRVIQQLLVSHPSIGRNMARRHLRQYYPQHAQVANKSLDALLLGCKGEMIQCLQGFETKDKMKMAHAAELTMPELSEIESRALGYLSTHGRQVRILSNKTQISGDGGLRPRGMHASITFQRSDQDWPSLVRDFSCCVGPAPLELSS